jgi:hypothetical protein
VTYARHGIPSERTYGVSNADLKVIAKTIRRQQALALDLYATGVMDAMYLAGIVADGSQMSAKQLQAWADGAAGMPMIAEHTVAWVTVESEHARALANKWIGSKREQTASSGWCTYSGMVATQADETLDLAEIEALLESIPAKIDAAPNRARYTMNGFVIAAGIYVKPLSQLAKATAEKLGAVAVDVGDTACKVPSATEYIAKVEAMGRIGLKRKTIRC